VKPPFSLVVLCGDGSRVRRFSVPRGLAYGALGLQAVVGTAMVGLSGDYAVLKRESGQMAALRRHADEQRVFIEAVRPRLAAMREDVGKWEALHDKMWKALAGAEPERTAALPELDLDAQSEDIELVASSVAEEGRRLRELARIASRTGKLVSTLPLDWPVRGPVNSDYGRRRSPWSGRAEHHGGIDIGSPPGTPVKAPAPGTVVTASVSRGDFGKHVTVDHGNGVRSRYGHLAHVNVRRGQRVEKGQVLGVVGNTGRSTGPHLHYELRVHGKPVDPDAFLPDE
jgi:septal ring factor EnvC (AmiA/AmiB activator)